MSIKVLGPHVESSGIPLLGFIWKTTDDPGCGIKTTLEEMGVGNVGSPGYLLGGHGSHTAERNAY